MRLMRYVASVIIASLLTITAAQQIHGFDPWWIELTRYFPYPGLLAFAGIALVLSFWLGRAWMAASASTLAFVLVVTMGLVWNSPARDGRPVRLMTYNIKSYLADKQPGGLARLGREILEHRPDILLLQDVYGPAERYWGTVLPKEAGFEFPNVYFGSQYIVASKYPLRDCLQGGIPYRDVDRRYIRCKVEINGLDLDLVDTHFESPRDGLNAARREGVEGTDEWRQNYGDRLVQSAALADDLKNASRPMIVAGDMNAPESSTVVRNLKSLGLRDAFSAGGRGYGYTYGQALRIGLSVLRIDHILISPEISVADCFVGSGAASPHRPVIADLWVRRPPATSGQLSTSR